MSRRCCRPASSPTSSTAPAGWGSSRSGSTGRPCSAARRCRTSAASSSSTCGCTASTSGGAAGVVFRSLEASRLAAVLGRARCVRAAVLMVANPDAARGPAVRLRLPAARRRSVEHGRARGWVRRSAPDPLADFLTARWGLFTRRAGNDRLAAERAPAVAAARRRAARPRRRTASRPQGCRASTDRPPDSVLYSPGVTTRSGGRRREPA